MTATQRETIQAIEMQRELKARQHRRCEYCKAVVPEATVERATIEGLNIEIHCDDCGRAICCECHTMQLDGVVLCGECTKTNS